MVAEKVKALLTASRLRNHLTPAANYYREFSTVIGKVLNNEKPCPFSHPLKEVAEILPGWYRWRSVKNNPAYDKLTFSFAPFTCLRVYHK
jgi:hypothetical protein